MTNSSEKYEEAVTPTSGDAVEWLVRLRKLAGCGGAFSTLGFEVTEGGIGAAAVAVTLDGRHTNFFGSCHGGVIFALADSALGLAANSYGAAAVAIDAHITFSSAAREGNRLIARATEIRRGRTVAVYRVDVRNVTDRGAEIVSTFTGTVFIRGAQPRRPGASDADSARVPS